jgi:hypothetical protein
MIEQSKSLEINGTSNPKCHNQQHTKFTNTRLEVLNPSGVFPHLLDRKTQNTETERFTAVPCSRYSVLSEGLSAQCFKTSLVNIIKAASVQMANSTADEKQQNYTRIKM